MECHAWRSGSIAAHSHVHHAMTRVHSLRHSYTTALPSLERSVHSGATLQQGAYIEVRCPSHGTRVNLSQKIVTPLIGAFNVFGRRLAMETHTGIAVGLDRGYPTTKYKPKKPVPKRSVRSASKRSACQGVVALFS